MVITLLILALPCIIRKRNYHLRRETMSRQEAPPGTVTRATALRVLRREGILTSAAMLLKLRGVTRVIPEGRTHGFYNEEPLLRIVNDRRKLKNLPPLGSLFEEEHKIEFRQAKVEDLLYGAYDVAVKLFGATSPARDRIPLFERCPIGNFVVTDQDAVVGFAILLPMKREPIQEFLAGRFRGSDITADHLDPFEEGKVVDVLVKCIGCYHDHMPTSRRYSQWLLSGLKKEIVKWGEKGFIIHRVYGTSETPSGITLALEFKMQSLGKISGSRGHKRYAFEIDPQQSEHPIFRKYCKALEAWREQHPLEYDAAWEKWKQYNA
jgi:hypothetical protein